MERRNGFRVIFYCKVHNQVLGCRKITMRRCCASCPLATSARCTRLQDVLRGFEVRWRKDEKNCPECRPQRAPT
jgi:hypothetical protein